MCCQSSASPPSAGLNQWVLTARSAASCNVLAVATAGIANTIMNDTTSCAHTKSGMRLSDMPGARSLNAVTMMFTAATRAAISVNVTTCAQTSTRCPGEYCGPESGTYAVHPASGPMFRNSDTYMNTTPTRYA